MISRDGVLHSYELTAQPSDELMALSTEEFLSALGSLFAPTSYASCLILPPVVLVFVHSYVERTAEFEKPISSFIH